MGRFCTYTGEGSRDARCAGLGVGQDQRSGFAQWLDSLGRSVASPGVILAFCGGVGWMLVGPPHRAELPRLPVERDGMPGILRYLEDLHRTLTVSLSSVVGQTIGLLGVRGLSSSGTGAQNFVKTLAIGNQTSVTWAFDNPEPDASYLLFSSPRVSTGVVMTGQTRGVTNVVLTFLPAVPSGLQLDLLLLR